MHAERILETVKILRTKKVYIFVTLDTIASLFSDLAISGNEKVCSQCKKKVLNWLSAK